MLFTYLYVLIGTLLLHVSSGTHFPLGRSDKLATHKKPLMYKIKNVKPIKRLAKS